MKFSTLICVCLILSALVCAWALLTWQPCYAWAEILPMLAAFYVFGKHQMTADSRLPLALIIPLVPAIISHIVAVMLQFWVMKEDWGWVPPFHGIAAFLILFSPAAAYLLAVKVWDEEKEDPFYT